MRAVSRVLQVEVLCNFGKNLYINMYATYNGFLWRGANRIVAYYAVLGLRGCNHDPKLTEVPGSIPGWPPPFFAIFLAKKHNFVYIY